MFEDTRVREGTLEGALQGGKREGTMDSAASKRLTSDEMSLARLLDGTATSEEAVATAGRALASAAAIDDDDDGTAFTALVSQIIAAKRSAEKWKSSTPREEGRQLPEQTTAS